MARTAPSNSRCTRACTFDPRLGASRRCSNSRGLAYSDFSFASFVSLSAVDHGPH
jgi:hypothetical protein